MHVDVQQDAVVYGQHLDVHVKYNLNYGVPAAMATALVHVADVITIKALAAALTIKNQLLQHQVAHTECVQVEYTDV
jgi:hypothetical protein